MDFKDYFSKQAKEYSKYRPKYPPELFEYLSSLCAGHGRAWDCATGSGQAAMGLEPYFDEIIATDASASQIEHAELHPKIKYHVAKAEDSGIESASCDLITVATAIHWIDTDKFYPEIRRILKPGGVIAVWTYAESSINPAIDKISQSYSWDTIGIHWPPENKKAWNFEELIDFPFNRIKTPDFKLTLQWSLEDYINYLYTWSATHNYINATGKNPIELVYEDFKNAWGDEELKRDITFPIEIKVAKV
jgi:ubiquinone/menaquinone biosynthesis C-methylase UbiE